MARQKKTFFLTSPCRVFPSRLDLRVSVYSWLARKRIGFFWRKKLFFSHPPCNGFPKYIFATFFYSYNAGKASLDTRTSASLKNFSIPASGASKKKLAREAKKGIIELAENFRRPMNRLASSSSHGGSSPSFCLEAI